MERQQTPSRKKRGSGHTPTPATGQHAPLSHCMPRAPPCWKPPPVQTSCTSGVSEPLGNWGYGSRIGDTLDTVANSQERSKRACKANTVSLRTCVEPGLRLFCDRHTDVCHRLSTWEQTVQPRHAHGCPWHPSTSWLRFMQRLLLTATKDMSHWGTGEQAGSFKAQCPFLRFGCWFFFLLTFPFLCAKACPPLQEKIGEGWGTAQLARWIVLAEVRCVNLSQSSLRGQLRSKCFSLNTALLPSPPSASWLLSLII